MPLALTDAEMQLLGKVLERYRGDLSMEIADTDNSQFRDRLRDEQQLLAGVLEKLKAAGVRGA